MNAILKINGDTIHVSAIIARFTNRFPTMFIYFLMKEVLLKPINNIGKNATSIHTLLLFHTEFFHT